MPREWAIFCYRGHKVEKEEKERLEKKKAKNHF
jgi:hypothetical protein